MLLVLILLELFLIVLSVYHHISLEDLTASKIDQLQLSLEHNCAVLANKMYSTNSLAGTITTSRYYDYIRSERDSKLWVPYTTPEYRQALIYMNRLYSEGLFSEFSWSISRLDIQNMLSPEDGVNTLGIVGNHPVNVINTSLEYWTLAPLEDETGMGGTMDPSDDNQWQEYLQDLKAVGLYAYMDAAQSAYTRMYN